MADDRIEMSAEEYRREVTRRHRRRKGEPLPLCDGCGKPLNTCECLELHFLRDVHAFELVVPLRQYKFYPGRKFRADFAWPEYNLLVDIQGYGLGHYGKQGYEDDCEKQYLAAMLGWVIVRFTGRQIRDGKAVAWVGKLLEKLKPLDNNDLV